MGLVSLPHQCLRLALEIQAHRGPWLTTNDRLRLANGLHSAHLDELGRH